MGSCPGQKLLGGFFKPFYVRQAGQEVGTAVLAPNVQWEHAPRTSRGHVPASRVCSQDLPKDRTIEKVFGACVRFSALSLLPPLLRAPAQLLIFCSLWKFLHWGMRADEQV